jgi:HAD superfamily hydrolase (TIGR01509 family)
MTKAILFDVDGLVIKARKEFFSERLARKQGISDESVRKFFMHDFKQCSFGKADLKEKITPFLEEWRWEESVDDLLVYWFESESSTDEKVLEAIKSFREKEIKCYIATRQEKYRFDYLLNTIGLAKYFDGAFSTCDIGFDKSDPKFYEYILDQISFKPSEVLFFDDTPINIETALLVGIESYLYVDINTLKQTVLHSQN